MCAFGGNESRESFAQIIGLETGEKETRKTASVLKTWLQSDIFFLNHLKSNSLYSKYERAEKFGEHAGKSANT